MHQEPIHSRDDHEPQSAGWLFAAWLLQDEGEGKAERLKLQLQAAAASCSEQAASADRARASNLICGAWAADLASRLVINLHRSLAELGGNAVQARVQRELKDDQSCPRDALAQSCLAMSLNAFMAEARHLPEVLEEIGFAALWLGLKREGAALVHGAATLRGGPMKGAMAEAEALVRFGNIQDGLTTLRCATRMFAVEDGTGQDTLRKLQSLAVEGGGSSAGNPANEPCSVH